MLKLLAQMGVEVSLDESLGVELSAADLHKPRRALRAGEDDARLDPGARPACSRASARRACRCPAAARSACGRWTSTSRACRRWAPRSAIEHGYIHAARRSGCKGARIFIDLVTVTGTENLMMAATLAEGTTVIENAAREPEVVDLAQCLERDGRAHHRRTAPTSSPSRASTELHGAQLPRDARPHRDRDFSASRRRRPAATSGCRNARPDILDAVLDKLQRSRCDSRAAAPTGSRLRDERPARAVTCAPRRIPRSRPTCRRSSWRSTRWHRARGHHRDVFENRFMHVQELRRLGAHIEVEGNTAVVQGVTGLDGRQRDGDRPARFCVPRAGGAGGARGNDRSIASTTSIAATSASKRSSRMRSEPARGSHTA